MEEYKGIHETYLNPEFFIKLSTLNGGYEGTDAQEGCSDLMQLLAGNNYYLPEEIHCL